MTAMTPAYSAIIRAIKINGMGKIGASAGHTWRTSPVAHADTSRTHLNQDWRPVSGPAQLRAAASDRLALADNVKNNSVLLIEYVVSAAHEAFIEQGGHLQWQAYFEDALAFLEARHGVDNVIGVNVQLDERTPHLVVYAVPLVEHPATTRSRNVILGKVDGEWIRGNKCYDVPAHTALSASHFLGNREKLRQLQTSFAQQVGEKHGLCRGLRYSAATHLTTKEFHQELARGTSQNLHFSPERASRQGPPWNREGPIEHAQRLTDAVSQHYAPLLTKAATADIHRRRADEMAETARRTEAALDKERHSHQQTRERLHELVDGLSVAEVQTIEKFSRRCRDKHRENAETRRKNEEKRLQDARLEKQQHEDRYADELRHTTPEQMARLSEDGRTQAWRFAISRDDLGPTLEHWVASGLLEPDSTLTKKGKNYINQSDGVTSEKDLAKQGKFDIPAPLI